MTPLDTLKAFRKVYPTPMSNDQIGALLNAVAWAWRDDGLGLYAKTSGALCYQPFTGRAISRDYLVYKDGRGYDVLLDAEGKGKPQWGRSHEMDTSRWVKPVDPVATSLPPPTKPPTPATTTIPYDEAKSIEFGQAVNDIYRDIPESKDAGKIAVFATRAAYDHYVGRLPWPAALGKHLAAFRSEYGL